MGPTWEKTIRALAPLLLLPLSGCLLYFMDKEDCERGLVNGEDCFGDVIDTGTSSACAAEVLEVEPAQGASDVYIRSGVSVLLAEPDFGAFVMVDGVPGQSEVDDGGLRASFTPDSPLDWDTTYTAIGIFCDGDAVLQWEFRTQAAEPSVDPVELEGRRYRLNLSEGRFVQPEGVGSVLEQYLEEDLWVQVQSAQEGALELVGGGVASDGQQDLCSPQLPLQAQLTDDNRFDIGPVDIEVTLAGAQAPLYDATGSGLISSDGQRLGGVELAALVDTRALVHLVEEGGEDGALCDIVAGFGVDCEPCPDGETLCVTARIIDLEGEELDDPAVLYEGECDERCQDENGACMDSDCGCASGGRGAGWLGLLAGTLLLRRRR